MLSWYGSQCGLRFVALRYFNASGASGDLGERSRSRSHLIPNLLAVPLGRRRPMSILLAMTPRRRMEPASATTSTSPIWPMPTCWLWTARSATAGSTTWGQEKATRCGRCSTPLDAPPATQYRRTYCRERAGDPAVLVASAALAERELGWRPRGGAPSIRSMRRRLALA